MATTTDAVSGLGSIRSSAAGITERGWIPLRSLMGNIAELARQQAFGQAPNQRDGWIIACRTSGIRKGDVREGAPGNGGNDAYNHNAECAHAARRRSKL